MGVRRTVSILWAERTELATVLLLLCLVKPAAFLRLRRVGDAAAWLSGFLLAIFTRSGRQAAREFRAAFPVRLGRALGMSIRWNSVRPREFLAQQRILAGYTRDDRLSIRQENDATVREWIAQRRSFVVALAHFGRDEAAYASLSRQVLPVPLKFLTARPPGKPHTPREWRIATQYQQIHRVLDLYEPYPREAVPIGEHLGISKAVLRYLSSPGAVVCIMVDSPWSPHKAGAYSRPFAGARSRTFATGAGFLGRVAQCPVVLCLPARQPDGSILIRWSDPVEPPLPHDRDGDRLITDRLLDLIEIEAGHRPTDYLWPLGGERRWNPAVERWDGPGAAGANVAEFKLWSRSFG